MSSSSVCQGLQSCLEPQLIEPRVVMLKLALAPPGSNLSRPCDEKHDMKRDKTSESGGSCGWSFLQSLSNISHCNKNSEDLEANNVYVHPTVKCSSSVLSTKSLEMCTESLGCETGSNASDDEISLFSSESSSSSTRHHHHKLVANKNSGSKRLNRGSNFPPPLTSMTDLGGVKVMPHREDGRLILEAVTSPSPQPYFHAERSNGRLRLRLFENFSFSSSDCDDDEDEVADDEGEDDEEKEEETQNQENYGEEDYGPEDEKGTKMFARPSRCKESGKRDIFGDGYPELPSLSVCP